MTAPRKRHSNDTRAILAAIERSLVVSTAASNTAAVASTAAAVAAAKVATELTEHTKQDDDRHVMTQDALRSVIKNQESLLNSRTYAKGMWKMASLIGMAMGAVLTALIAWFKK